MFIKMELVKVSFVILASITLIQALPSRPKRQTFDWDTIAAENTRPTPSPEQQQNINNAGPVPFPEVRPVSEDQNGDTSMPTRPPFVTRRTTASPAPTRRPQNPNQPTSPSTTTTTANPRYTACMEACRTTLEYNPICGSDRITYPNEGRLKCAQRCGQKVEKVFGGACSPL